MTCIVALEHKGFVWVGGDSMAVDSQTSDFCLLVTPKVFERDGLIFGCTGEFRQQQALMYALTMPARNENPADDERWICTEFMEAVRETLRKAGTLQVRDGSETISNFIVGYRGAIYEVESNFAAVRNTRGYAAVGCGAKYALGNLHGRSGDWHPEDCVRLALEAAEALNAGVRAPFTIIHGGAGRIPH